MMKLPAISGVIRRRILLNYRVDPEVAAGILPNRFRPKIVRGHAIAGICLIRLENIRPKGVHCLPGIASENTAHRIAVEWSNGDGHTQDGVFVPRRDTDSRLNSLAGGRIFPGVHHYANFAVDDRDGRISIRVTSRDFDSPLVEIQAEESDAFPDDSIFVSLDEVSDFFEAGCVGYSSRPDSCTLDGMRLSIDRWRVEPLHISRVASAYFDDTSIFPDGSIAFDHALIMRDIEHEWQGEPTMDLKRWDVA